MEKNSTIIKAVNKNVRSSPRKIALVLDYIRGKKADIALRDLQFTRKKIALDVSKTVKEAYVGKSLVMKRFRPRAKGRASPIKKPFSRITIVLGEKRKVKDGPKN